MLSSTTPINAFRASRARHTATRGSARAVVATSRGPMPDVLVVEAAGYETARDNPGAVVVDRERRCLRRGRLRLDMRSERTFRLLEFVLLHREQDVLARGEAFAAATLGCAPMKESSASGLLRQANRALEPLGLRVESIWGGSLRLAATERSPA